MRLKDYLRGLGIGVVVTVLILSIADNGEMTDAQVRARALELGMVDGTNLTLSDIQTDKTTTSGQEEPSEEIMSAEESEGTETSESMEPSEQESASAETIEDNVGSDEQTEESGADGGQPVTITVERGDSSVSVSRKLETAGLVDSAKDFDAYLCQNSYDKRIGIGNFEILPGSTYEEIAKIISKSK